MYRIIGFSGISGATAEGRFYGNDKTGKIMVRRFDGSTVLRVDGSTVRRFEGSTVERSNDQTKKRSNFLIKTNS